MLASLSRMPCAGTPGTSILVHCGLLPLSCTLTVHTVSSNSSYDAYKSVWSESSCLLLFELLVCADTCSAAGWGSSFDHSFHIQACAREGSHSSKHTSNLLPVKGSTGGALPLHAVDTTICAGSHLNGTPTLPHSASHADFERGPDTCTVTD